MKLKPLAEILAMTKEKIDETLAPMRARHVKAKADMKIAELEEKGVTLERQIHELCTTKDIDFDRVADLQDQHALNERRAVQMRQIVSDLFPEPAAA